MAWAVFPTLILLWIWWPGLKCWFQQDDFAWLGLHREVRDWPSFWHTMFAPMAQGTIRPWSERGFFLLFWKWFGLDAVPYRIMVFLTASAALVLLGSIVWRLTGSVWAATAAPALWVANASLTTPLCWTADYNEIQCAFFLFLAFRLYLAGFYWWQLAVFVLGFGALELNVVYPALVLAWVLCSGPTRRRILATIPLWTVSAVYYLLHRHFASAQAIGPYALSFDSRLAGTLAKYWSWVLVPDTWHSVFRGHTAWMALCLVLVLTASLALPSLLRREGWRLPVFGLLWFAITLAPFLPLPDHITDYYLVLPASGLALAAGSLIAQAKSRISRAAAAVVCAVYLWIHVPVDHVGAHWFLDRSREVRSLILGVQRARELHPGKTIVLTGIPPLLYAFSVAHSAFPILGMDDVYLSPESVAQIPPMPNVREPVNYAIPAQAVLRGIADGRVEVYSAAEPKLREMTMLYKRISDAKLAEQTPRRVDVANPLLAYLLGPTWYAADGNFRWMPRQASVRMGGPPAANKFLLLTGFCPPQLSYPEPLPVTVSVDGVPLPAMEIRGPETQFSLRMALPTMLTGRSSVEVTVTSGRTMREGTNGRELALAFGVFEIP